MHGPAACREAGSAAWWATRTRRIAARATRTLKDGTAALNRARTAWRTGVLRRWWGRARRRGAVDGPRAGLRHDHALDRHCRDGRGFRRLRRSRDGRGRYRRNSRRWWSSRRCGNSCRRRGRRRGRGDRRTRHHRACRSCRGDCRTRRGRSGRRCSRNRRTGHHWSGGRLRGNGRSRRRRRGHDGRRLARLRHDNAARRRGRFGLGSSRGRGSRRRNAGGSHRRRIRLGNGWRRRDSLRARRGAVCLFFTLLNRLQDIAGLGDPRPVNFWCSSAVVPGSCRAAIPAVSTLEMRAHALRLVSLERTGMRLGVRDSYFLKYVQNRLALDFELSC
jgi:hypothetical protein